MSTPKINFFIQAGCRAGNAGPCPGSGPVTNNCSGYRPGSSRARDSAGGSREAAGEDPGKHPGVPRCQHPEPEQLFPIPDPEDPDPEDPDVVNPDPDDIITRTILRFTPIPASCSPKPDPEPRLSRTFPDDKRPTAPAKRSSYSAGLSLSAATGICSASMGISAGVTSFMRFLARSINSCSCSTI